MKRKENLRAESTSEDHNISQYNRIFYLALLSFSCFFLECERLRELRFQPMIITS